MARSPAAVKRPQGGATRELLSYVLGTRAKVACLRVLTVAGEPITQRDAGRRAGIQHRSAQVALDELVALGVARRIQGGRDYLVSLNDEHYLVPALREVFRAEGTFFAEVRRQVADVAREVGEARLLSVVLFGSVARGDDRPGSDLDLLVICRSAGDTEPVLERLHASSQTLRARFGYQVRPLVYGLPAARGRWRQTAAPLSSAVHEGLVLRGTPLRELLNGPR
jgi:predicted nucleotidyltransferase